MKMKRKFGFVLGLSLIASLTLLFGLPKFKSAEHTGDPFGFSVSDSHGGLVGEDCAYGDVTSPCVEFVEALADRNDLVGSERKQLLQYAIKFQIKIKTAADKIVLNLVELSRARPAVYDKHILAKDAGAAMKMSNEGKKVSQYVAKAGKSIEDTRIELEELTILNGTRILPSSTDGGNKNAVYYFLEHKDVVGYANGKPTKWIRAEITGEFKGEKFFHGHPRDVKDVPDALK